MSMIRIGVPRDWPITERCATSPCDVRCDFAIKRHDTKPHFRVKLEDCNGPMDLRDPNLLVEVNLWFPTKLRYNVGADDTELKVTNNFNQALVGDVIMMNRPRLPEQMLIVDFDEDDSIIHVQRGYNGTMPSSWRKGMEMLVFRQINAPGYIETVVGDTIDISGEELRDQLLETYLAYAFTEKCTCLPGCLLLEFKLVKMKESEPTEAPEPTEVAPTVAPTPVVPTGTPEPTEAAPTVAPVEEPLPIHYCIKGLNVEWVRRFPVYGEFVIHIIDSPTAEPI